MGLNLEIYANTTQQWHSGNLISPEISSSIRDAIELASNYNVDIYFSIFVKEIDAKFKYSK